jgi:hypothetical protein
MANLFSPTWVVKEDSDQLKCVEYYSLFRTLERIKGSVIRASSRAVSCTTRTRHAHFYVRKSHDLAGACVYRNYCIIPIALSSMFLPLLRIASTQL